MPYIPQGLPGLFAALAMPNNDIAAALTKLRQLQAMYRAAQKEQLPNVQTLLRTLPWSVPQPPLHNARLATKTVVSGAAL